MPVRVVSPLRTEAHAVTLQAMPNATQSEPLNEL